MKYDSLKRKIAGLTVFVVSLLFVPIAQAQSVPNVITFQSVLFDDSGNVITDDSADILFRILDDQNNELYAEEQPGVQVFNGMINVLVGSGIVPGSSPATPTGGLSLSDLDPSTSLFLEVTVGQTTTLDALELTSVPYAFYAQEALSLASGAITIEHIENITLQDIGGTLDVTQLPPEAATDSEVSAAVAAEATDRANADAVLQAQLDNKLTKDGTDSMTGDLNIGGNDVTNVGTVDGWDVNATFTDHESRLGNLEGSGMTQVTRSLRWVTNVNKANGGQLSGQDAADWALGGTQTTDGIWTTITRNAISVPSGCIAIASGTISPNVVSGTNSFLDEDDPMYLRIVHNGQDINMTAFGLGDDGEFDINFRVMAIPTSSSTTCTISF